MRVEVWDPAGFTAGADAKDVYRRQSVSMLACVGCIVQLFVHSPGFFSPSNDLKFVEFLNGLQATTVVSAVV